jgi:hypothetical protein
MGKKNNKHTTADVEERDDAVEGVAGGAKQALDELTQSVSDVGEKVRDASEKGVRAASGAKDLVAEKAHEGAMALRRRRRQTLAMMVAGASLVVATIARRVARKA